MFGHEDVRNFLIGIDNRANTSLLRAASVSAFKLYTSNSPGKPAEARKERELEEQLLGRSRCASVQRPGGAAEETTRTTCSTGKASNAGLHQDLLAEMLRLKLYVER